MRIYTLLAHYYLFSKSAGHLRTKSTACSLTGCHGGASDQATDGAPARRRYQPARFEEFLHISVLGDARAALR
jgi:hypothetical protein